MAAGPFVLPRVRPSVHNRECGVFRDGEREDPCARQPHALLVSPTESGIRTRASL